MLRSKILSLPSDDETSSVSFEEVGDGAMEVIGEPTRSSVTLPMRKSYALICPSREPEMISGCDEGILSVVIEDVASLKV